jgi:hypothetical protein
MNQSQRQQETKKRTSLLYLFYVSLHRIQKKQINK